MAAVEAQRSDEGHHQQRVLAEKPVVAAARVVDVALHRRRERLAQPDVSQSG